MERSLSTRPLSADDAGPLSDAFRAIGWSKPTSTFRRYCDEEVAGERWTLVAEWDGGLAGYVTLAWAAEDPELRRLGIPEIMDINVLPGFQRRGIGSALLAEAEDEARHRSELVGLRVGLHSGYGPAQRIYVRRGYVPDGAGAVVGGAPVPEGADITLDDDVTLRMIKDLKSPGEP